MRFSLFVILLLGCYYGVSAQELLPSSQKIKKQYDYFVKEKRASLSQVDFISAFPDNKDTFLRVFYPYEFDQLYEQRHDYMAALKRIGAPYPKMTLAKIIPIAKDLKGNQDIVGDLQDIIIGMANNNIEVFAAEAKKLSKQELHGLAVFFADAEDRAAVLQLADKLKDAREFRLAKVIGQAIEDKTANAG